MICILPIAPSAPPPRSNLNQYSHSRLSCFENCPKQFEYRYIQKIEIDTEGIEAFLGKRVHEILERLYHHVARHRHPPSLAQVQERFRKDWRLHWHDKIEIVRKESPPDFYLQQGERCLENYYRSEYPFDTGETVALEQRISVQLDDEGQYLARGIIDRITKRGDGAYEIHDYKTSGSLPQRRRLDQDRQLGLYQIGLEQTFTDAKEVELIWHYMTFNRTIRSRRSVAQLDTLRAETIALIDKIEAADTFPAKPGPLCSWCGYREICPAYAGQDAETPGPVPVERRPTLAQDGEPHPPEPVSSAAVSSGVQLSLLD
jgi:putative RecB family exonuclease